MRKDGPRSAPGRAPGRPARLPGAALALALALALGVDVRPARAAGALEVAGAPVGLHPFAARALPVGAATAYFNPALLPYLPGGFELGVFTLVQSLSVDLEPRPGGVDVPESIYQARVVVNGDTRRLERRPLPTADLPNARGSADPDQTDLFLALGHSVTFLEGRLAFGLFGLMPLGAFQQHTPFFADEREQYFSNSLHFELLGDRSRVAAFAFGAGGRPVEWLSLGAGIVLVTAVSPHTDVYVPDTADQETAFVRSESTTRFQVVPHFGLAVTPIAPLLLTATVHLPLRATVGGETELQFWNYPYPEGQDSLVQSFDFAFDDLPLRVSAGAAWTADGGAGESAPITWRAAATATWTRWSTYRDRVNERPSPRFSDTVSLAVAGEVGFHGHRLGLDLTWVPTPVPAQRGRTNHVDADRVGVSLAWDWTIPLGALELVAGVQLQAQPLLPRSVTKSPDAADPVVDELPDAVDVTSDEPIEASRGLQTNNPGYPGFSSSGALFGATAWARLRW